jgi:ATP-binding cassette subfamily B protein
MNRQTFSEFCSYFSNFSSALDKPSGANKYEAQNIAMMSTTGASNIEKVNPTVCGAIRFENLHYSHSSDSKLVLRNINLEISPGQQIAIVGEPGCGKSLIAKLLLRFYDLKLGRITIDGKDIRDFTVPCLWKQISMVAQNTVMFPGSVRENICFGIDNCPQDVVEKAAQLANANNFIDWLPHRYLTRLGDGGMTLSRSERQRLAIARSAVRRSPILILDEPTKGLDSLNEKLVLQSIYRIMSQCTTIYITNKLQTVRGADLIVYMRDGRILESGTHDQLIQRQGEYSTRYRRQQDMAFRRWYLEKTFPPV